MDIKIRQRLWRVRNKQPGVILLPYPPLSDSTLSLIPINGTAVVEQDILESLGDLVEIIEEAVPKDTGFGFESKPPVALRNDAKDEVKCEEDFNLQRFFQDWTEAYGKAFRTTSDLLSLASSANLKIFHSGEAQHQRVSQLGKSLRRLAKLDNTPWVISTRRRSNRTEYSLSHTLDPDINIRQNP